MLEKLPAAVGRALQSRRAGLESTVSHRLPNATSLARIEVHSSAFEAGQPIPVRYTADEAGLSPPLEWKGFPDTGSLHDFAYWTRPVSGKWTHLAWVTGGAAV
jgi:hypothetical protein